MTEANSSSDLRSFEGQWKIVYSEIDGEMTNVSEFSTITLTNKGDHFVVEKGGEIVAEGKFSIDTATKPHQLTYTYSKGKDVFLGGPRPGIFQLEGNTLKTCQGAIGRPAPKDFNTSQHSPAVLTVYQKRGAEKGNVQLTASKTRVVSQW